MEILDLGSLHLYLRKNYECQAIKRSLSSLEMPAFPPKRAILFDGMEPLIYDCFDDQLGNPFAFHVVLLKSCLHF